jgi:hypothetical protein
MVSPVATPTPAPPSQEQSVSYLRKGSLFPIFACVFSKTAQLRCDGSVFLSSRRETESYFSQDLLMTLIKFKDFRLGLCNGINHLILITYLSKKIVLNGM